MTKSLTILFLVLSLSSFEQTCDTIRGKLINCIDTSGLKQGQWEITKKNILMSGYGGLGSKEGCRYFEVVEYYPLAIGEYKDNRKIGTWKYYWGNGSSNIRRKMTYNKDGSIEGENLINRYKIRVSSDTLKVNGLIHHKLDTMNIDCQNKSCSIRLSNGQQILNFKVSDLNTVEFELLRLRLGIYDREIKKKKLHKNK